MRRDVFQAIADPTRRQIIEMVAQRTLNVNEIAENFDVSRQAVSLQIKILIECGLVVIKKRGRERFCEAKLDQLQDVAEWVAVCEKFWKTKFTALEKFLGKASAKKLKK